jgi:hypothetical protein
MSDQVNKSSRLKPRFTATYFVYVNSSCEQRLSSFHGTKRQIINRLKRLNPHSYTDGLQIHDDQYNLLWGEEGVLFIGEFFTDDEWFEISGEKKEVDDCALNLEKLFAEDQEEQHPEEPPFAPVQGEDLGLDPFQPSSLCFPKVPHQFNIFGFYHTIGRPVLPLLNNRILSSRDPPGADFISSLTHLNVH